MRALVLVLSALSLTAAAEAAKTLDIYFVDVEGGQATLIVSPSGQSMLVDTGFPGFNGRDSTRIAQAAKAAGVRNLDYLVITHYHSDHVGGVAEVIAKLPVRTFVDHGPNVETSRAAKDLDEIYAKARATGKHMPVKAGDKIPLKGVDIEVVTANGEHVARPVKNGGGTNPQCNATGEHKEDPTENARSVGFLLTFGKFRFVDLGDLTARREVELACPENRIGPVDLYLTTHHGADTSNAQPLVHGMRPRVAIMNNGPKKGGSPTAWQIVRNSPGLEDLWQLHFSLAGGKDNNVAEPFIANLDVACEGKYIKVSALADGSFTVTNSRNKYSRTYKPGASTSDGPRSRTEYPGL